MVNAAYRSFGTPQGKLIAVLMTILGASAIVSFAADQHVWAAACFTVLGGLTYKLMD